MDKQIENQQLYQFLQQILAQFERATVVLPDGRCLAVQSDDVTDIGTLPLACHVANQYLRLTDGEICILNDPYSGGTNLSTLTWVLGVSLNPADKQKRADLLIGVRRSLWPSSWGEKNLDQDGIRIPPTPIYSNGQINHALMTAMSQHPLCPQPAAFLKLTDTVIRSLKDLPTQIRRLDSSLGLKLSKFPFKTYLDKCQRLAEGILQDLPVGDTRVHARLHSGEKINLQLEVKEGRILVDFSGSETHSHLNLTHSATFSACFGAFCSMFEAPIPMNSGSFHIMQITTPNETLVNAKAPSSTNWGTRDGVALVASMMIRALGQMSSRFKVSEPGYSHCGIFFDFGDSTHFFDELGVGGSASEKRHGTDGTFSWFPKMQFTSVERIESDLPLQFLVVTTRQLSGGKGKYRGGHGVAKSYRLKAKARVRWCFDQSQANKPSGAEGGKAAAPAVLLIAQGSSQSKEQACIGSLSLEAGDVITIMSPGGGGYGQEATSN